MITDVQHAEAYATRRHIQFLEESNKIENIYSISYRNPYFQMPDRGHFGAFVASQESAKKKEPLTASMIALWQGMITAEQVPYGHPLKKEAIGAFRSPALQQNVRVGQHIAPDFTEVPGLMDELIQRINAALQRTEGLESVSDYVNFLGHSFHRFEWIHPFVDGNGRTGRLLANYINTYCGKPIMVFYSEDALRQHYFDAHLSPESMCSFMALKIREAIYVEGGRLMLKQREVEKNKILYLSEDGPETAEVEWNE